MYDPYANKIRLGKLVREAAKAATHDEKSTTEFKRINDIQVCEAFINMLADTGCMITRIPRKLTSIPLLKRNSDERSST